MTNLRGRVTSLESAFGTDAADAECVAQWARIVGEALAKEIVAECHRRGKAPTLYNGFQVFLDEEGVT